MPLVHPNSTRICCDGKMLQSLKVNSLSLGKQLLGQCPSCFQNFMNVFCAVTCDPNSSLFMNVRDDCLDNNTDSGLPDFTNFYADKFCEFSQESSKVISLMCGSNNPCTGPNLNAVVVIVQQCVQPLSPFHLIEDQLK